MYTMMDVIYGVPITPEMAELESIEEAEANGSIIILYSGNAEHVKGYCGVCLYSGDEVEDIRVSSLRLSPTPEEKKEVQKMIDNLPADIRKIIPPIDVYIVWSTS